jgi:hypothetical protein
MSRARKARMGSSGHGMGQVRLKAHLTQFVFM